MSVQSEITRITGLKDRIGDKLTELGVITEEETMLEEYTEALEGVTDNGGVSGSISTKAGVYTVPKGYHDGTGKVQIAATEQQKIVASNIKSGVTILGVAGTYSGEAAKLQSKTVTPTKSQQTVSADEGYDALSSVVVNAIPNNYQDTTGATAVAGDVLTGKVFITSTGKVTGTMANNGAVSGSVGLTEDEYTIPAGYHSGTGKVTLNGDIEAALAAI